MDPTKQTPRFDTTTVSSAPHALDIDALVRNLERLAAVPQTMSRLVSTGKPAVRALRRLLLGPPDADPTPRVLAVTSLGRIHSQRAIRALIAALCRGPLKTRDPALLSSEHVVRNAAARELARLGVRSAAGPLIYVLRRDHLIEAGRALLRFGDARAIPYLVECLSDEAIQESAAALLVEFGEAAVPALRSGMRQREERLGVEAAGNIVRRAACARLLGRLGAAPVDQRAPNDWPRRARSWRRTSMTFLTRSTTSWRRTPRSS